jgi:hypothetical protein
MKKLHALSHDELQIIVQEIDELVGTEFCSEMDMKTMPNSKPYTQEEAEEMANIIGRVYLFAHKIHCEACRDRKI